MQADRTRPVARALALACLVLLATLRAGQCAAPAASEPALIYVEPQRNRTFGPQRVTRAGTVFHVKVLTKADNNAVRIHRCGEANCKSAETVKQWQPGEYRTSDELTWRAEREGTYYLWMQDPRDGRSLEATTHWFIGNRTRIAFDSGAVIEVWYEAP
jgi:hypothetical protein